MACNVIAERAGRLRNPSHLVPKPEFEQVGSFEDRRRRYSSKLQFYLLVRQHMRKAIKSHTDLLLGV